MIRMSWKKEKKMRTLRSLLCEKSLLAPGETVECAAARSMQSHGGLGPLPSSRCTQRYTSSARNESKIQCIHKQSRRAACRLVVIDNHRTANRRGVSNDLRRERREISTESGIPVRNGVGQETCSSSEAAAN